MKRYLLILIILCSSVFAAEIDLDDEMNNIPAKVKNIRSLGHWEYKSKQGYYRIIHVAWHNACSLLYIQWMESLSPENPRQKVLATLSIKEFNANDHIELIFPFPKIKLRNDKLFLYIEANSGHDDKKHKYKIEVFDEFRKYTIRKIK